MSTASYLSHYGVLVRIDISLPFLKYSLSVSEKRISVRCLLVSEVSSHSDVREQLNRKHVGLRQ